MSTKARKRPTKKKLAPLIPPDLERCQAEHSNGYTFMTLGGVPGMVRCKEEPKCIIYETEPGEDGRKGSMALCPNCFVVLVQQRPSGWRVEHIQKPTVRRE